jgi:hypothetical protein
MEIESTRFTQEDLEVFVDQVVEHERDVLVGRLEAASEALAASRGRAEHAPDAAADGWSPREILAHIGLMARLYGFLAAEIGKGRQTEIDLLPFVAQRDVAGAQAATRPVGELVEEARGQIARTVSYLRSASPSDLRRRARMSRWETNALEVATLNLCAHLELHVAQLEEALGT